MVADRVNRKWLIVGSLFVWSFVTLMICRPVVRPLTVTVPSSAVVTPEAVKPPVNVIAVAETLERSTVTSQPSSGLKL